jgi:hypothetical protein
VRDRLQAHWIVPAACGTIALLLAVAAVVPSLVPAGWSLTALPRVDASTGMGAAAKRIDPSFHVVVQDAYDGQFNWGIAIDPLGRGDVHQAFDAASYRYGHPLYGWFGWLGSADQARATPAALTVVGVATLVAAAVLAGALGMARGTRGWEGLFVALNPGLLYAAAHTLAEPLVAALLLGALWAYVLDRRALLLACLTLLPLAKEEFVVVALVLAGWELLRERGGLIRTAAILATVIPAAAWWVYARIHFGAWFSSGDNALGTPFVGWKEALRIAGIRSYDAQWSVAQLGEATIIVLAALLGLVTVTWLLALRLRGPIDPLFLALGAVAACLAPIGTVLLRDAVRNTAVLLVLVPFVIASLPPLPRSRARLGGGSWTATARSPTR